MSDYPDTKLEIVTDNNLTEMVAEGFDAGVSDGEQVAKDMIAVRVDPTCGSRWWGAVLFAKHPKPKAHNLAQHESINLRLLTYGAMYATGSLPKREKFRGPVDGQRTA